MINLENRLRNHLNMQRDRSNLAEVVISHLCDLITNDEQISIETLKRAKTIMAGYHELLTEITKGVENESGEGSQDSV